MQFLIIRLGALGDFIQTLPAIGTIRHHFPHAVIHLMGYPAIADLARGRYYADQVSRFDQPGVSRLFSAEPSLPEGLAHYLRQFEVILSYVGGRDGIFTQNLKQVNSQKVFAQHSLPDSGEKVHVIDHLLQPVLSWGLQPPSRIPRVYPTDEDRTVAASFLLRHGISPDAERLLAIHPGSGGRQKCWPAERYAEVIRRLDQEGSGRVLLVEGPADDEAVKKILRLIPETKPIRLTELALVHLAAILERCHAFLGNDSGVTHLAAAVGTQTLAIFGPTDPEIWGPRGSDVQTLYRPAPCSPCTPEQRHACGDRDCLHRIGVEDVMEALRALF